MFERFKNRKKKIQESNESSNESQKKSEERVDIQKQIERNLENLETDKAGERIQLLNQLGKDYLTLDDLDHAIKYFELSLSENKTFGDAYNGLLNLYEKKRKIAAKAKDDAQLQFYINKLDSLLKISKEMIFNK